jgi:predicted nucleotidyltransferase
MIETEKEQFIRTAKIFGNGAHVFVPKEWAGEEIIIVRPRKKSLKERILSILEPYLDSILGVYLYGSYARDEQTEDSDIDLFVITDKKIKIKSEGFEVVCLEEKDIEKALKIEPVLIYSILSESKPIINSKTLHELKTKYLPKLLDFQSYIRETKGVIRVNEDFIQSEKGDYLTSEAVVYSLVLRLRGLFIIKSILEGKRYSHRLFKAWVKSHISKIDFDSIYEAYRLSKYEKKIRQKIKVFDIKLLIELLKNEIDKIK